MDFLTDSKKKFDYKPVIFSGNSEEEIETLNFLKSDPNTEVLDEIDLQLAELIKLDYPSVKLSALEIRVKVNAFLDTHLPGTFSNWVYYPWRRQLVHILKECDFIKVRTARNKFKITQEEQDTLLTKKVGIIGLSVGQSVALSMAMERSFGELRIADFDTLELSNMNRVRTGLNNLGIPKTHIVAREIAEIDPYLKVTLFDEGVTLQNIHDFFLKNGPLDLVIEECDTLPIKIAARLEAKKLGIPVLMDTSDKGRIDIERFDLDPELPIFHGELAGFGQETKLIEMVAHRYQEMMMAVINVKEISDRGKFSLSQMGKTINAWPQLGSAVVFGGGMCAHYARKILLNETTFSGRFYVDLNAYL
ncbi:ThiF family adenylyltransferase [Pararhodonellum marinum]|uniref:ThiF family adenylyltransferase n=1 Tax=Pararhodonellum marinum TaxID=2755358 RepID=UPI00188F6531|nr:ThiF family adenylyltransferase [Pararhodonellum marinum]